MANRQERGVREAIKAARRSDFHSHRVGAAVFLGATLIATGYNQHKSHPKSTQWTVHAEFDSLIRLKEDLSNAVLYVARLTRTNKLSCSKPCAACQQLITKFGIKKVFYTNHQGILEKLA